MVQDAQAFGDSTTSVSIDRSVARTRVEELRVLEEDGSGSACCWPAASRCSGAAGRCRPARCPASRSGPSTAAAGSRPTCSAPTWPRSTSAAPSPPCSRRPSSCTGGPATSTPAPGPCTRPRPGTCRSAGRTAGGPGPSRPTTRPAPGALRPRGPRPRRPGRPGRRLVAPLPARRPGRRTAPGVPGRRPRRPRRLGGPDRQQRRLGQRGPHQRPGGRLGASSEAGWRSLLTLAGGFSSLEASVHWKGPDPEPLALLVAEQDIRQLRQDRWMARVVDVPGRSRPAATRRAARAHHHRGRRRHLPVGRRDLDDRGRRRGGQGGPGRGRRRRHHHRVRAGRPVRRLPRPRDLATLGVVAASARPRSSSSRPCTPAPTLEPGLLLTLSWLLAPASPRPGQPERA